MKRSANITSVEVIRAFTPALQKFEEEVRDALVNLTLELRRAVDWLEHDRTRYWPHQLRRASQQVAEARGALERCEMAIRPEDKRGCYEEKKQLQKALSRHRLCEQKIELVKHWIQVVRHESDEFEGQIAKMSDMMDVDVPRAVATLQRMAAALDRYVQRGPLDAPAAGPGKTAAGDFDARSSDTEEQ